MGKRRGERRDGECSERRGERRDGECSEGRGERGAGNVRKEEGEKEERGNDRREGEKEERGNLRGDVWLLCSLGMFAACGIGYELILATVSSYLFGDSVYHFSLTVGLFLSGMGLGAWWSRVFVGRLLVRFVWVELWLALLGGILPGVLLFVGVRVGESVYRPLWVIVVLGIGALVGVELPLLTRVYQERVAVLRLTLASVLTADYVGALVGSLCFPLWLLPRWGLLGAGLCLGLINAVVAVLTAYGLGVRVGRGFGLFGVVVLGVLGWGVVHLSAWEGRVDRYAFRDVVRFKTRTPYQEIVLTQGTKKPKRAVAPMGEGVAFAPPRWKDDLRMFLNGNLQWSAVDEHRYHEALVHPSFLLWGGKRKLSRVLILGGGDGLALREVLRHGSVERVTLVDLDAQVVQLFREHPMLQRVNEQSFADRRVRVVIEDAFRFVRRTTTAFDLILVDLPDPRSLSLARLYTRAFYRLLRARLSVGGMVVTQASSPFFAPHAYWCVGKTLQSAGYRVYPYHVHVHSFGEWGFHLASTEALSFEQASRLDVKTQFLDDVVWRQLFVWPRDLRPVPVEINRLLQPRLFQYYRGASWASY